jgi:integrase
VIASCGLRISEGIGVQRKHLHLNGANPHLKVRRAIVKRRVEPPKTKRGRRDVPLPPALTSKLRTHVATLAEGGDALVFPSGRNTPLDPDTLRRTWLKALMEEIGAPGCGFHSLRHTFASLQLAGGVNVVQLSEVLGHHSAAFTLSVYTHLIPGEGAPPLDLTAALDGIDSGDLPAGRPFRATEDSVAFVLPEGLGEGAGTPNCRRAASDFRHRAELPAAHDADHYP